MEFINFIENNDLSKMFNDYDKFVNEFKSFIYEFIGNEDIKKEVINIFKTIIFEYLVYEKKPKMGFSNVLITGDPGVGKTTLALYISKMMYYFGFDNFFKNEDIKTNEDISLENLNKIKKTISYNNIIEKIKNINKNAELAPQNLYVKNIKFDINELKEEINFLKKIDNTNINIKEMKDIYKKNNIVNIYTPSDFIAGYVGQTTIKTREILEKNRGKIIIIDEAYGFATSKDNWFGKEALIEINSYMSEYPDEYMFIFCGYKDLIKTNILDLQPGIERRIRYNFNISKYSVDDLVSIFLLKINKFGVIKNIDKLKSSFQNIKLKNYGGDIEIIVLKLRTIIANNYWNNSLNIVKPIEIKQEWIDTVISEYKETKIYSTLYI